MQQAIWKWTFFDAGGELTMPAGAEIIHIHEQNNQLCLWARVDAAALRIKRRFKVVGTGYEDISPTDVYLGTVHLRNGLLVLHVFEII